MTAKFKTPKPVKAFVASRTFYLERGKVRIMGVLVTPILPKPKGKKK